MNIAPSIFDRGLDVQVFETAQPLPARVYLFTCFKDDILLGWCRTGPKVEVHEESASSQREK